MKHIFLLNQNKKGDVGELIKRINTACTNLNYDFVIIAYDADTDILEFARLFKNNNDIIYAVGDDQDLNLVLNGIFMGKAKLGIIPIGENNGFYRSLDEYKSEIKKINVFKVNQEYGLNMFSLGFDAQAVANLQRLKKLSVSEKNLNYLSLLYTYFKYKNQVMGINNYFEKRFLLAICNGAYNQMGYSLVPSSCIHSKDVYVVSVGDISKMQIPGMGFQLLISDPQNNPYLELYRTDQKIQIETMNVLNAELDGRIITGKQFNILPNAGSIEVVNNRSLIRELRK